MGIPSYYPTPIEQAKVRNRPERPDARKIVLADAAEFGWQHIDIDRLDVFRRDTTTIHILWTPVGTSLGSGRLIDGKPVDRDRSALCIVRCRQWLRGSTDLLGSARL